MTPRPTVHSRRPMVLLALVVVAAGVACARGTPPAGTLVVFNAGSLARPLRAALDRYAAPRGIIVQQENAGSLETARKLTELHKIPDIVALADDEVFPQLLMPGQTSWYARFAHNRMVIAYTSRSRYAAEIDSTTWWRVLQRPGVQVGRANPDLDPNGYRTLMVQQLAERYYHQPGLAAALLRAAPERNVRPKEVDLVGLLQAGELDYIWSYESLAREAGLRFVDLPARIDLGSQADSAYYAQAVARVAGKTPADTLVIHGQPIVYGLTIPTRAPHPDQALGFVRWLLSPEGIAVLRAARLDALDAPVIVGRGAPCLEGCPPDSATVAAARVP